MADMAVQKKVLLRFYTYLSTFAYLT